MQEKRDTRRARLESSRAADDRYNAVMSPAAIVVALGLLLQGGALPAFDNLAVPAGVAKSGDPGAVAWFDFDGDGDQDLFVATIGPNKLFRNNGDGTFAKVNGIGLDKDNIPSFGVAVADFNNDGRLDLFVANVGFPNKLYRNDGDGRFRDVTRAAGVGGGSAPSYSAAWADYDRDGWIDLYVANGSQNAAARNFLYHNNGDGTFREVADSAGVGGNEPSLGCAWADYDDDGLPDIFVANFGKADRLYRNNGDGTFTDRAEQTGVAGVANGAGAAWGDFDNDGHLDLYVFNTNAGASADRLYRNRGDGSFDDVTAEEGLSESGDGESVVWGDFDLDGRLDLFLVNRSDFSPQRNRMFRNLGSRFVDITREAGVAGTGKGQPAAAADYDGDGALDLFVGNLPGTKDELLHCRGLAGHALVVNLVGTSSNRAAIGARVTVEAGGLSMMREVSSSSGRSSQNQIAPHFGLGDASTADSVTVTWPSGAESHLVDVAAGTVEIVEP